jgi:hypothetical protein
MRSYRLSSRLRFDEHSDPVLEAAHIIPYSQGGEHRTSSDLVRLDVSVRERLEHLVEDPAAEVDAMR